MDNDQMKQLRKRLWLALDDLRNFSSIEDAILWIAALLYLRKNNALFLDTRSEKIIEEENESLDIVFMLSLPGGRRLFCNRCALSSQNDISTLLRKYIGGIRNGDIVRNIVEFVMDLNNNELSEIDFLSILDLTIEYGSTTNNIQHQPHEISVLVDRLLDSKVKTVFDPFGGRMDFATTLKDKRFVAFEKNKRVWELGMFRLAIAGILEQTEYSYLPGWLDDIDLKFDAIATIPPFGSKDYNEEYLDEWALHRFEKLTNEQGRLVTVVPMSILYRGGKTQELRKTIIKNNWLEAVVYLPSNIFLPLTGISAAVIVLRKKRKEEDEIRVVDALNCFTTTNRHNVIDVETIVKQYNECEDFISNDEILKNN